MEELKKKFLSPENLSILLSRTLGLIDKRLVLSLLVGLVLIGFGVFYFKNVGDVGGTKVEVLDATTESQEGKEITVEIAGEVENPGVYKLSGGARVEDLLVTSGGFSQNADRGWTNKYLNRAAKLTDGQKVYIPKIGEQTLGVSANNGGGDQSVSSNFSGQGSGLTNINTASLSELDKLPGIGLVYGQSIIDHRPYSTVEELLSKGALKKNVYEKIKDRVGVY